MNQNCIYTPPFFMFAVFSKSNQIILLLKNLYQDFPGDPVVKNLPANTGDMGSILGRSHILPSNSTWTPQLLSSPTWIPCSTMRSPHTPTRGQTLFTTARESTRTAVKTQGRQKKVFTSFPIPWSCVPQKMTRWFLSTNNNFYFNNYMFSHEN